ncbi:hypothetical protein COL41_04185 [Bacillus mycoides]|uniref:glycosyltransferase n=1 Tax=Bacillus mycoides TaxID=1405 RepID=UPI000BF6DE7E|nr:glycosyltransferase [Bacillus mycoides]PFX98198.1 hypothetical protein COL41_04185 [Bacillus mycoides]QWH03514.1 hypothetical protein EXW52_26410 [Bacillus mycoides]
MKKILIVAYYIPPFGGVGAVRVTKLIKYFYKMGWDITVLTVDESYYDPKMLDHDKLKDIDSSIKIVRTKRMSQFTSFQEEGFYWLPSLYKSLRQTLKKEKYDYVYYTGGPFIHWTLAPIIKKISGVPYILDFRDPWLLTPYNSSKIRKLYASIVEPGVVKNASLILNVTDDATNMYMEHYQDISSEKFITIPNGYDPDDFKGIESDKVNVQTEGIKIVYTGKFGSFRDPKHFLEAIYSYNKINKKKIYFVHVGEKEGCVNKVLEENPNLNEYTIQTGFVSYRRALSYINESDICLIISGGHPYEPTTKIYDYIALNKEIICINDINYGYLYETLKNYKGSYYVRNNTQDILEMLSELSDAKENVPESNHEMFNREVIFTRLNDIILKNKKTNGLLGDNK